MQTTSRPSHLIPLPSARAEEQDSFLPKEAEMAAAIARAQENLLRQQRPDGHWCGELLVDSTLCSDFIVFMHWLGDVDATRCRSDVSVTS